MLSLPQGIQKIGEGRQAEIFAWTHGAILKLYRDPAAHLAAEWEALAMNAARVCGHVPAVHGITTVLGRPGLVMERIDGTDLLTALGQRPWQLLRGARILGTEHARLHEASAPVELPALRLTVRQRVEAAGDISATLRERALATLATLPDGDRLCHGDMHPGNLILTPSGPVVIDWPNARRGDAAADVALTLLTLNVGAPLPSLPPHVRLFTHIGRRLFSALYLRSYRRLRPVDDALLGRWRVVRLVDRLEERIPGERPLLLKLLERHGW